MNKEKCILCRQDKLKTVGSIDKVDLINLYKDSFGFDISPQLKNVNEVESYLCTNCRLEYFDPNAAGDGSFYEQLQLHRDSYYSPNRKEFSFAEKFIESSHKILEVGSGCGLFAQRLNKENYIGLEFNDKAIADAADNQIVLLKESIESFSKHHNFQFDVVCSFHVLEHVKDPLQYIEASLRVLKSGGKLIIAIPCNDSIYTSNLNHVLNLPPHHIGRWRIETMLELEKIFNLKILDYQISSPRESLEKEGYIAEYLTQKICSKLYFKNRYLLNKIKIKRIRRIVGKLNNVFKLYRFYNDNLVYGENMTFVFERKL